MLVIIFLFGVVIVAICLAKTTKSIESQIEKINDNVDELMRDKNG